LETELEVVEGMQFDRGYISPTSSPTPKRCALRWNDAYILIYEKSCPACRNCFRCLEAVVQASKPLVIVAEDVEGEALATARRQQAARRLKSRR